MPQEARDTRTPKARVQLYTLLQALRAGRDPMLGTLPIELRPEWERRLG